MQRQLMFAKMEVGDGVNKGGKKCCLRWKEVVEREES